MKPHIIQMDNKAVKFQGLFTGQSGEENRYHFCRFLRRSGANQPFHLIALRAQRQP